jgi:hypothetical protein
MIEMRYLEKTHLPEHDGATGFNYKVLQYRYQITTAQGLSILTDWIDVPTVTAPTA